MSCNSVSSAQALASFLVLNVLLLAGCGLILTVAVIRPLRF
ncbi:hypothetical protein P667_3614 [Acinetobacter baumannii UH5107]|nr:hypothetical protein P667_3614 [Acinetobacter baumannii UH5107]